MMTEGKEPPADVAVNIQSAKRLVCATVLAAVGFGAMFTLIVGVELHQFDPQEHVVGDMLDQYNSYLATITSAVLPPMGKILAIIVSLGGLCFASNVLMTSQPGLASMIVMIVVSTGMNFVISNGFNSVNVQPQVLPMQAIMNTSDLGTVPPASTPASTPAPVPVSAAVLSNADGKPLDETVFRTLLHPPETVQQVYCSAMTSSYDFRALGAGLSFGFPAAEWQAQLLPNGHAPSKALEISLNASTTNQHAMPLSLKTASSLMVHMMLFADELLTDNTFNVMKNALAQTPHWRTETGTNKPTPWATFDDVFYPDGLAVESATNQAAFVNKTASLLRDAFARSMVHSIEEGTVKWTRNELMDGVVFEAMTLDLPLIADLQKTNDMTKTNSDWYATGIGRPTSSLFFPVNDACNTQGCGVIATELQKQNGDLVYPDPIIQAIAECQDPNVNIGFLEGGDYTMSCNGNKTNNNSMLVVAVARRSEGDGMYYHNFSVDWYTGLVEFVNIRKYYTLLVGRLSWKTADQAIAHHGQCNSTSCLGLRAPLINADNSATGRVLLAGESALPVQRLHLYNYGQDPSKTIWTPLVTWTRGFPNAHIIDSGVMFKFTDELAFPWQFKESNFTADAVHNFAKAYTAALYFLLQGGVVRDVIPLTNSTTTLDFDGNTHAVGLRASIPPLNAKLTLLGCIVVGVAGLLLVILSPKLARKMEGDLSPHIVAKMLLNGTAFPSVLLECQVGTTEVSLMPLKQFTVGAVILSGKDDSNIVPVTRETLVHVTRDDKPGKARIIPVTSSIE